VSPKAQFYRDVSNLLSGGRASTRRRAGVAFYTYNTLGGEVELPKFTVKQAQDGSDLIGSQFWSADNEDDGSLPISYTIVGTSSQQRTDEDGHKTGPRFKCVDYCKSSAANDGDATKHFSRVGEARKWLEQSPPSPSPLHSDDDVTKSSSSLFCDDESGDITIGPSSLETDETAAVLRLKIRAFVIAEKPKKIPRHVCVAALRGQIKKEFFKCGTQVPPNYRAAMSSPEAKAWIKEMDDEIKALSDLGAFRKGLTLSDLPSNVHARDVIRSIWVYDVKVDGRKRARFAARGDMETHTEEDDNFSPVAQMKTVRLLLAVAAQLNLELVTMDFPKAFLLGKMDDTKPIFMYAPEGHGKQGEIFQLMLPLYGLTIASRKFYESLSEFMRAIGFTHFGGGDPCLFRRSRLMPTPEQALSNHQDSVAMGMEGRPLINGVVFEDSLPRGPQASKSGPTVETHYPYPDYMDKPQHKSEPNVPFETFHADGVNPLGTNGLRSGEYFEMAAVYVDDLLLALTHESAALARLFMRRFGAKISPPGSMYLGLNYEQNLFEGFISIGFQSCLERTMERIKDLTAIEIGIRSLVGILLWLCLHIFATHLIETKSLARRTNQNLPEDGKTALALIYELYQRRGQKIYYRRRGKRHPIFVPRASRVEGVADVSNFYAGIAVPETLGEILVTPDDIFREDGNIDVYSPEEEGTSYVPEQMTIDTNFVLEIATDASCAADQMSRRSDLGVIIFINGGPVDWCCMRMSGIADSSCNAEHCAMSIGTKQALIIRELLRFIGVHVGPDTIFCDSTSAMQVARNPHTLGAARSLGIRMHGTRYAVAKLGTKLKHSISEGECADFVTKRMPRKKLARLSVIFYNNLRMGWESNPDVLLPLRDGEWHPDIHGGVIGQPSMDLDSPDEFQSSSSVQVFVTTSSEKRHAIDYEPNDAVMLFKIKICAQSGVPVDQQLLSFGGKHLLHGRTLNDYGIFGDTVVNMVVRPRGGRNFDSDDEDSDDDDFPHLDEEDDFDDEFDDLPDLLPIEQEDDDLLNQAHYPDYPRLSPPNDHIYTPAQRDWSQQYMPVNASYNWPPNALMIMALLGHRPCHEAYEHDSIINRRYHLIFYASWSGPPTNPPVYSHKLLSERLDMDRQTALWYRAFDLAEIVDTSSDAFRNVTYSRVAHAQRRAHDMHFVIDHPVGYGPGHDQRRRSFENSFDVIDAISELRPPRQPVDIDLSSSTVDDIVPDNSHTLDVTAIERVVTASRTDHHGNSRTQSIPLSVLHGHPSLMRDGIRPSHDQRDTLAASLPNDVKVECLRRKHASTACPSTETGHVEMDPDHQLRWDQGMRVAMIKMGPLSMNAMWNDAMETEMTRLQNMGAFVPHASPAPHITGHQSTPSGITSPWHTQGTTETMGIETNKPDVNSGLVRMDLDVHDMDAFLQDENLPHGDELDTTVLEESLSNLQSSSIELAPVGDFQALLRHARGKGHCDGAKFDLFADDLKYGQLRPASSSSAISPGTPPGSLPVVPSSSSDAPLSLPLSWYSARQDQCFNSSREAELHAAIPGNLDDITIGSLFAEDPIDDERLGVGYLVLGSNNPTFDFIRCEMLEGDCVVCHVPTTRLASCRTCEGYVCLSCGNPRCSKCDGHLIRDPNRMNYKLAVFPRATTPNDFYSSYVQTFTSEDRRRELLDVRSMAVEIAEEARLPFTIRMKLINDKREQDIKQV
jgi:hypothetical protein